VVLKKTFQPENWQFCGKILILLFPAKFSLVAFYDLREGKQQDIKKAKEEKSESFCPNNF